MKEKLNREFLDLRKFENPINAIELIKSITSNPVNYQLDTFISIFTPQNIQTRQQNT